MRILSGRKESNEVSDIPIFKSIENFKNTVFSHSEIEETQQNYFGTKDIPFTLGIYGEYSKIF